MKIILIYPYEDNDAVLAVACNTEADESRARKAIRDFVRQDNAYLAGMVADDDYLPMEEYLESKGIQFICTERIYLNNLLADGEAFNQ